VPDTWETSIWREVGTETSLNDICVVDGLTWQVIEITHHIHYGHPEVVWAKMKLVPEEDHDVRVGKLLQYESSVRMRLTPKARPTQWDHLLRDD
jgi:hypothetical protein